MADVAALEARAQKEAAEAGQNLNPEIHRVARRQRVTIDLSGATNGEREPFTREEIFDIIRDIRDPEHEESSLEELRVARMEDVHVGEQPPYVDVFFTPTIPHCSMATLIGLCLSVKLIRSLPARFKLRVAIAPGGHASEDEINKQLADKERVAAALENPHLLKVVNKCVAASDKFPEPIWAHDSPEAGGLPVVLPFDPYRALDVETDEEEYG
jgi:metal-sulfur cluster biosynthetic enzyme